MKSLILAAGISLLSTITFAQSQQAPSIPNITKGCVEGQDKVANLMEKLDANGYKSPILILVTGVEPKKVQFAFGNPGNGTVVEVEIEYSSQPLAPMKACITQVGIYVPVDSLTHQQPQTQAPQQEAPSAPKVEEEPKDQE